MNDINDGLDLGTDKIENINNDNGTVPGDKTDLNKEDKKVTNPPAAEPTPADKPVSDVPAADAPASDTNNSDIELTEGTTIEIGDTSYTVDKDGNAIDDKGNIFKNREELKALIAANGVEDNKDETLIQTIQNKFGIEVKDEQGNPIEFENTPEGISAYLDTVIENREKEVAQAALDTLFNTYPAINQALNYIKVNGSLEGFNEIKDRGNITVDKDNIDQQIAIIKEEWQTQGKKGNVDSYIEYLKTAGTLYDTAVESNQVLKEINDAAQTELAEKAKLQEQAEAQAEADYWKEVDGILAKKEIAGYKIPDTIPVTRDGKKIVLTANDFKNYISRPVDKDGNTQYMLDEMKLDKSAVMQDELLHAYLRFTGGDYSSLVGMAINKEKVKTIRIASQTSQQKTIKIKGSNSGNSKVNNNDILLS